MKSDLFEVGLLDQYHLSIPEEVFLPFKEAKQSRIKVNAWHKDNSIEFYAAIKLDKNTGEYRIMFGKRLQKSLGVFQNDYFTLQISKDTSKYGVDMPEELDAVFKNDTEAFEIFENLTAGKKRSIIYAVSRYKSIQTRVDKSLIVCKNLKNGVTNPMKILKS